MKNFYFFVTYHLHKYITFVLLFALLSGSLLAPVPPDLSMKIPVFAKPSLCHASTILPGSNDTVAKASTLAMDTLYEDTVNTGATHYYCLPGSTNAGYICITLTANEIPSLSFQLFDSTGAARSPSSYQYEPSGRTLQMKYFFSANENYLLAVSNLLSQSIAYTIKYSDLNKNPDYDKKNTSKPKKDSGPKKTSKPKITSKPKKTTKPKTTLKPKKSPEPKATLKPKKSPEPKAILKPKKSPEPKATLKPKNSTKPKTTSKPKKTPKPKAAQKQKTAIKKLTLSNTFLRISTKTSFSLKAIICPKNSPFTCQWIVSDSSVLGEKSSRKTPTGSTFTAKGRKKGTVIITCKTTGKRQLSASCTVKIV